MARPKKVFHPTSVRLPADLHHFLRKDATRQQVSLTTLLMTILRSYMDFRKAKRKSDELRGIEE